jgi:hypothetical protein
MRVLRGSCLCAAFVACLAVASPATSKPAQHVNANRRHVAALPPDRGAGQYDVGIGTRPINPEPSGRWHGQPVYLGGYGIGGPSVLGPGRAATGILAPYGQSVRAITIDDGTHVFVIADIEAQGWFAQTKSGRGLMTMRRRAAVALSHLGAPVGVEQVLIQSDHSHGGIDPLGVWGGIPASYEDYVINQTVAAITAAWQARRPGRLFYGTAPAPDLLSNQFGYDKAHGNDVMDSDMRVLQARDRHGRPFATLMNFSAHATVLDGDNTKVTGDWPAVANPMLEKAFGGRAMTMVGTLGRSQPNERGDAACKAKPATAKGDPFQECKLEQYAARVVTRAKQAAKRAKPLSGVPRVDSHSYLIQDLSTGVGLLAFEFAGGPLNVPFDRSLQMPWQTGNSMGTVTSSALIGDVLLSGAPGEMYPQIPLQVKALLPGLRGYMTAGLADDQLGYLIAPAGAYPEPIGRTVFDRSGALSPLDNDNFFFNSSITLGTRITCSLLRGADDLLGRGARDRDNDCSFFASDMTMPAGADGRYGK